MAQGDDAAEPADAPGRRRSQVLAVLQRSPTPLPVSEVARRLGLHLNTARFHLDHLVRGGQVDRTTEPRATPGRPRTLYRALPGASSGRRNYRLLAEILAGSLTGQATEPAAAATAAGRAWGRSMADRPPTRPDSESATTGLVAVLDRVGFAPEEVTVGRRRRVLLHHCPFLEAAQRNPEVVCAVHLGLMQGVLDEMRAPVVAERLEPWATPQTCVTHLASRRRGARGDPVVASRRGVD